MGSFFLDRMPYVNFYILGYSVYLLIGTLVSSSVDCLLLMSVCGYYFLSTVIPNDFLLFPKFVRDNEDTYCCFCMLIYFFNSIIFLINNYKFSGLAVYTNICDNLSTLFSYVPNLYALLFLSTYYVNYSVILPSVTNFR